MRRRVAGSLFTSSTMPRSESIVPPLMPPDMRVTTIVVSVSPPPAACAVSSAARSDGTESKPQAWVMRAPVSRARSCARSALARTNGTSPVRSA